MKLAMKWNFFSFSLNEIFTSVFSNYAVFFSIVLVLCDLKESHMLVTLLKREM